MHIYLLGQVTVTYVEPNSGQTITTTPVSFQLIRMAQPTDDLLQVNYTLDIQRNRVETAREIKRAMDESNYQRSLAILKAQVEKIKSSVSGQDPFCQLLIKDLEHHYPSERDYRSSHHNAYMQHSSERGTYAPTTTFSSAQYISSPQQQQAAHFQQQQLPRYTPQMPSYSPQQQTLPHAKRPRFPPSYDPQVPPYMPQQQTLPYAQQQQLPPLYLPTSPSYVQQQQPAAPSLPKDN
jgi:hypothetical protein